MKEHGRLLDDKHCKLSCDRKKKRHEYLRNKLRRKYGRKIKEMANIYTRLKLIVSIIQTVCTSVGIWSWREYKFVYTIIFMYDINRHFGSKSWYFIIPHPLAYMPCMLSTSEVEWNHTLISVFKDENLMDFLQIAINNNKLCVLLDCFLYLVLQMQQLMLCTTYVVGCFLKFAYITHVLLGLPLCLSL